MDRAVTSTSATTNLRGKRKLSLLPHQIVLPAKSERHAPSVSDRLFRWGEFIPGTTVQVYQPEPQEYTRRSSTFGNKETKELLAQDDPRQWKFYTTVDSQPIGKDIRAKMKYDHENEIFFFHFGRKYSGLENHSRIKFSQFESHSVLDFLKDILEQIDEHPRADRCETDSIPFFDDKDQARVFDEPKDKDQRVTFWSSPDIELASVRIRLNRLRLTGSYVLRINTNVPANVSERFNKWIGSTINFNVSEMRQLCKYLELMNSIPAAKRNTFAISLPEESSPQSPKTQETTPATATAEANANPESIKPNNEKTNDAVTQDGQEVADNDMNLEPSAWETLETLIKEQDLLMQ